MGSGSSAKKGTEEKYEPGPDGAASSDAEGHKSPPKPKPKLKKSGTKTLKSPELKAASSSGDGTDSKETAGASSGAVFTEVRPCDSCSEMRKTTNFGRGEDGQWLCAACQMTNGGTAFGQRQKQKVLVMSDMPKPQPILKRGATVSMDGVGSRRLAETRADASSGGGSSSDAAERKSRRRGAKARGDPDMAKRQQAEEQADAEPSPGKPKLTRAQTANLGSVGKPSHRNQTDYRSAQGLTELKEAMGVKTEQRAESRKRAAAQAAAADAMEAPQVPPAPPRPLAGGFTHGEKMVSLISRENSSRQQLIELGQEGSIVGAVEHARGPQSAELGLRLLVQFHRGADWWLAPSQVSVPSLFGSHRAAGIHGFSWGCKVRSLVTMLHPAGAEAYQEVWLGDEGTVIGPSAIKGKVAVRFDNGEWSIWPSLICESDTYEATVAQKINGKLGRGDRVRSKGAISGARSYSSAKLSLEDGMEGTVIGPGHSTGKVLVHFDADDRVWSVDPKQIVSSSSCM